MLDIEIKFDAALVAAKGSNEINALIADLFSACLEPGVLNDEQKIEIAAAITHLELARTKLHDVITVCTPTPAECADGSAILRARELYRSN